MTEEQMLQRIKEIDEQRNDLRLEKQKYQEYFSEKKISSLFDDRKKYIGKYYLSMDAPNNKNGYVKAFKVLDILNQPNIDFAKCIVLIDGRRSKIWDEYGIQIMTLGLWSLNQFRMMGSEADPKMIDFYTEIPEDIFVKMFAEYEQTIRNTM